MQMERKTLMTTENYILHSGIERAGLRQGLLHSFSRAWMGSSLLVTDMLSLTLAILIALQIRHLPDLVTDWAYIKIFIVLGITMAVLFYRKGLYPGVGLHYVDELSHIVSTWSVAFLVLIAMMFALQTTLYYSRLVLAMTALLSLFFIPLGRYWVRRSLIHLKLWGEPVAIIGDLRNPQKAKKLADYFMTNLQLGIRPVALLNYNHTPAAGKASDTCPAINVCRAKLFARNLSLKTVLIMVEDLNDINKLVNAYRFIFPRVILVRDQTSEYGLNNLKSLDFMDVLGLQVKNNLLNASTQFWKRVMDLAACSLASLLLAPLLGVIAVLIKLDSGGRIFYRQLRVGRDGRAFSLIKFRTMFQNNADQILKDALKSDPALQQEWDTFQKVKNDPRLTRVGKVLRRFSLDELPQLWNILRGEMSLVGPRPIMLNQRKLYGESIQDYIRVTPGITGLWQVSGRNETTFARRAALDIEYIQRWSQWLDIYIMLKTIKVVLWREGAY